MFFRARHLISRTIPRFAQDVALRARHSAHDVSFRARHSAHDISRKDNNSQYDGSIPMRMAAPHKDNDSQSDGSTPQSYIYIIDLCPQNLKNASICKLYISI